MCGHVPFNRLFRISFHVIRLIGLHWVLLLFQLVYSHHSCPFLLIGPFEFKGTFAYGTISYGHVDTPLLIGFVAFKYTVST